MSFIELKEVTFRYSPNEEPVLRDFSMTVEKNKCLIVEGDNGSGKTTLFRILNGLSFPEKGTFVFDGNLINREYLKDNARSKKFHKQIGYLFQNPDVMLFNAKVFDELAFGPRQMGLSDTEVKKRVEDCLNLFDLSALAQKVPYHLSGGQKKWVAFASIITLNPDVLVLDEPFAGMDRKAKIRMSDHLHELKNAGKTLIIATHDEQITSSYEDRRIRLE